MENNRRDFLKMAAAGAAATAVPGFAQEPQKKEKAGNEPVQKLLPRWPFWLHRVQRIFQAKLCT